MWRLHLGSAFTLIYIKKGKVKIKNEIRKKREMLSDGVPLLITFSVNELCNLCTELLSCYFLLSLMVFKSF